MREDGGYIEAGENDNLIVQKLEANPGTIGIFGYSYLEENARTLKGSRSTALSRPTRRSASFKYPGARPLYIYIKNAHASAIPAVRAYAAEFTKESAFGPNGYLLQRRPDLGAEQHPRAQPAGRARTVAAQSGEPQVASRIQLSQRLGHP